MEGTFIILLIAIIFLVVVFFVIVSYQRKIESEDLRKLDLQIIALEKGGEFIADGIGVLSILHANEVAYASSGKVCNVIQLRCVGYNLAVFDSTFAFGTDNKHKIDLTGIALRFDQERMPSFKITQNVFLSGIDLSRYPQVPSVQIPSSLRQAVAVFAPSEAQVQVSDLLRDNPKLQDIVTDWDFRGLFCNDTSIVLYLRGSYESTEDGIAEMIGYANQLVSIFGKDFTDIDIKALKRSEKNAQEESLSS